MLPHLRQEVFQRLRQTHETNLISNHVHEFIKASFSIVTVLHLYSPVPPTVDVKLVTNPKIGGCLGMDALLFLSVWLYYGAKIF